MTTSTEAAEARPADAVPGEDPQTCRCRECGRMLTDSLSRIFAIGPKCRSGLTADQLAAYFTPPTDD